MYKCMYVWMYVCMYVCLYLCLYVCIYVCMYVCMHVCLFVCMCIYNPLPSATPLYAWMNETCCIRVSHGTHEWVLLTVNDLCHMWTHRDKECKDIYIHISFILCHDMKLISTRSVSLSTRLIHSLSTRSVWVSCRDTEWMRFMSHRDTEWMSTRNDWDSCRETEWMRFMSHRDSEWIMTQNNWDSCHMSTNRDTHQWVMLHINENHGERCWIKLLMCYELL